MTCHACAAAPRSGRDFVSPKEALLGSVSRQANQFCQDANDDGVIGLSEGCLAVCDVG